MEEVRVSEKFKLTEEDIKSVIKGAAIAGAGAFATYLVEGVSKFDFGEWTPLVVAALSILINIVRKWVGESSYVAKK